MKKSRWNLYLGDVGGISLYLHWTFFILVVWIFFSYYSKTQRWQDGALGILFILSLFTCVVLHELGHAFMAKRFGCRTRKITLLPIGGMAQMEKIPEKPREEFLVAIAGPWVNIVIAAILFIVLASTSGIPSLTQIEDLTSSSFIYNLFFANIVLVIFNLIPAFPMDGGRVLRALLSIRLGRVRATTIATSIGQLLAIGLVFIGVFFNFFLVVIGLIIFLGARAEAELEVVKASLQNYKVKDVLMHKFTALHPADTLNSVVRLLLDGQEKEFVVVENGEVAGVLTQKELIQGLAANGGQSFVGDAMRRNFLPLDSTMNLHEAFEEMSLKGQKVCPVMKNGQLAGILDTENISEFLLLRQFKQAPSAVL